MSEIPDRPRSARRLPAALAALAVAVSVFAVAAFSITARQQLGTMGAFQATWFGLGLNVAGLGTLGNGPEPSVYKPPGYPLFIGGAVRLLAGRPQLCDSCQTRPHWGRMRYGRRVLERSAGAVYWAQALVQALAAGILCLYLATLVRLSTAVLGALLFGLDAVLLVLVGGTHYPLLHLLFVIAGCALLAACLARAAEGGRGWGWWWLAGVVWGLATLVRPITLILPPFVLAGALGVGKRDLRRAVAGSLWLVLGMATVILPQTVRNYRLTGRLIPVNAQFWSAVFGSSAAEARSDPNHMRWDETYSRDVASRAFHRKLYGVYEPLAIRENLILEDAYREATLANLSRQPMVYVRNVLRSLWSYSVDTSTLYPRMFRHYQQPGGTWPSGARWLAYGDPAGWPGGDFYGALGRLLTLLGLGGALLALVRRDARLVAPALVHLCMCVAHSISWMDFTYLYLRLPFNVIFALYLLDACLTHRRLPAIRLAGVGAAAVAAGLLAVSLLDLFLV